MPQGAVHGAGTIAATGTEQPMSVPVTAGSSGEDKMPDNPSARHPRLQFSCAYSSGQIRTPSMVFLT
jgi:hypothetical protein